MHTHLGLHEVDISAAVQHIYLRYQLLGLSHLRVGKKRFVNAQCLGTSFVGGFGVTYVRNREVEC